MKTSEIVQIWLQKLFSRVIMGGGGSGQSEFWKGSNLRDIIFAQLLK